MIAWFHAQSWNFGTKAFTSIYLYTKRCKFPLGSTASHTSPPEWWNLLLFLAESYKTSGTIPESSSRDSGKSLLQVQAPCHLIKQGWHLPAPGILASTAMFLHVFGQMITEGAIAAQKHLDLADLLRPSAGLLQWHVRPCPSVQMQHGTNLDLGFANCGHWVGTGWKGLLQQPECKNMPNF